jgi:hypothetical protein
MEQWCQEEGAMVNLWEEQLACNKLGRSDLNATGGRNILPMPKQVRQLEYNRYTTYGRN